MLASKLLSAVSGQDEKLYPEDCFSTYLYTGNGSTQTINNGIDLAGKGGLVWVKARSYDYPHILIDTARGVGNYLSTCATDAQAATINSLTAVSSTGFTLNSGNSVNDSSKTFVSWTFRHAKKFFDVVTYTGNGVAGWQIPHDLGAEPGFITTKSTSTNGNWNSYHRSATGDLVLNSSAAQTGSRAIITAANDSTFTVSGVANTNGVQYVAYLWAHDPSADGIVQCGSYVGNGSSNGPEINLGWEPQLVLVKMMAGSDNYSNWLVWDSMRGFTVGADAYLNWNNSLIESWGTSGGLEQLIDPTSTGFKLAGVGGGGMNNNGTTYIYLAIRRPPPEQAA